jgi:hypothetical protein
LGEEEYILQEEEPQQHYGIETLDMCQVDEVTTATKEEIFTTLSLDGFQAKLKVDTGAKCNVMPTVMLEKINTNRKVDTSRKARLVAYCGDSFITDGTISFQCPDKQNN